MARDTEPATPERTEGLPRRVAQLERQLAAVQRVAAGLSAISRVEELAQEALELCLEIAEAEAGSIALYDPRRQKLVYRYTQGERAEQIRGLAIAPDEGLAGEVFRSGHSRVSEDVSQESRHLHDVDEWLHYHTQNMLTVPLLSLAGEPIGVMQVLNKRSGQFDEDDLRLVEIMASQVALGLESARLAEEARLATVVRFLGNLSHDVKNMVTPLQTGAETLLIFAEQAFAALDEYCAAYGPQADAAVQEATGPLREMLPEMVEMFLEAAEAVQSRMTEIAAAVKGIVSRPHFEVCSVPAIAERVLALLKPQAERQGVRLSMQAPEDLPEAEVDRKQLYNALYNLLFNAVEACHSGDSVTLEISSGPQAPWPGGHWLQIVCRDTGAGIPPEVQARLFTEDAVSTKPMGTGLGTKIIANVVNAHGGTLAVDSELGRGTAITCRLPLYQPPR